MKTFSQYIAEAPDHKHPAYKMGFQHGRTSSRKINAEKGFGVKSHLYHKGYDHGKAATDREDWSEEQKNKVSRGDYRR